MRRWIEGAVSRVYPDTGGRFIVVTAAIQPNLATEYTEGSDLIVIISLFSR